MKDEALRLALEALETPHPGIRTSFTDSIKYREQCKEAITAIKQALAAPDLQAELEATNRQVEILSDALAESRRERQWVGLTDEEVDAAIKSNWGEMKGGPLVLNRTYVRAIEAKLKEKNGITEQKGGAA